MNRGMRLKRNICLAVGFLLVFCSVSLNVYAESQKGADGWKVTFDGDKMTSNFHSQQVADALYELQPGDEMIFHLDLSSSADFETDWYMSNAVIKSLEDTQQVAENGGYTYVLIYMDEKGNQTTLYNSEKVGGEKDKDAGIGLNEISNALDDFFFIDRLKKGQKGSVELLVTLDGESQGNVYQDTMADLQMNFAVEKVTGTAPKPQTTTVRDIKPESETDVSRNVSTSPVKTGDRMLWASIGTLAAGLGLIIAAFIYTKKQKGEEEA